MRARTFTVLKLSCLAAVVTLTACSSSKAAPDDAGNSNDAGTCTPKAGYESAVPFGTFGSSGYDDSAMVLDDQGDPMIAFVATDPNGDGKDDDDSLYFVSYDRATCTWRAPVRIDVIGPIDTTRDREVTLARDPSSGQLGVGYQVNGRLAEDSTQVMLAQSSDDGATWTTEEIAHDGSTAFAGDDTVSRPTVAMKHGKTFFAYYQTWALSGSASNDSDANAFHLLSRTGTSGAFTDTIVPPVAGATLPGADGDVPALAIDDSGNAGFIYIAHVDDASSTRRVCYFASNQTNAVAVFDSEGTQNDSTGLDLVFEGDKPRIVASLERGNDAAGSSIWFSASDDGVTWSAPVEVPKDGGDGMGSNLAIASDGQGRLSVATESSSETGEHTCGAPKLATSTDDGATWTTCGPPPQPSNAASYSGDYVQVAVTPAGKRVMVSCEGAGVPSSGISVWREP